MRKTIIFDLDGTLADITHRLHHIQGEKKHWPAFYLDCKDDKPIKQTIEILNRMHLAGYQIVICSGRSNEVYHLTVEWLTMNGVHWRFLHMRDKDDYQPDETLKEGWLKSGRLGPIEDILCVFDDRKKVVDMWRKNGLLCYQVAEGDF